MKSIKTDFNAVGDGVTDDTAAFQAAIDSGNEVYIDWTAAGYKVGALNVNKSCSLIGPKHKVKIVCSIQTYVFNITASDVRIEGLSIWGDSSAKTFSGFWINTTSAPVQRVVIENIDGWYLYHGVVGTGTNMAITIRLENCMFRLHKGYGVNMSNLYAFGFFNNVTFDCVGQNHNLPIFTLSGNAGAYLSRCFVLGSTPQNAGQSGFNFINSTAVHLSNCHADTLGGIGYSFTGCSYVQMDHVTASLCNNHGIAMSSTVNSCVSNVVCLGRRGMAGARAGTIGFYLLPGSRAITASTILSTNFTSYNVYYGGIPGAIFTGVVS